VKWLFVVVIVAATIICDYLQSRTAKRHSGARLFGQWPIALSVVFMAISFFAFTQLLAIADLSFAVPATAMTIPAETVMARFVLEEKVDLRRWTGAMLVAAGVVLIGF
jgi:drug/metabolite transporter (DMT)-like permease